MMEGEVDWIREWESAKSQSFGKQYGGSEDLWMGYWDVVAESYLRDSIADEPTYRNIISHMTMESCFEKGDTVLDIGCGPGTYTLLFAEEARRVDALDTSERMLATLMEETWRRGLPNIRPLQSGWEELEPEERYGLVFSGMSPAVHDAETLLKMERWALRGCCVVTYGEPHEYPVIKDLWGLLVGEYRPSNAYLYVYPYGVLQQEGRKPSVGMFHLSHSRMVPVSEVVTHYTRYFSIFTPMNEEKAGVIRRYFEDHCRDGFFENVSRLKLAAVCWKVPRGLDGP